jgi:hypothetical protein
MTAKLAPRLDTLEGKRVGLWANRKLNSEELLRQVELELEARHEIAGGLHGIYNPGRVMLPGEWGPIDACDAVILANGD